MFLIREPGEETQVYREVRGFYQLPDWTADAEVCTIRGHGELQWFCPRERAQQHPVRRGA